jgi:hypothetical protein
VVVGDPEGSVPRLFEDFRANSLRKRYVSPPYDAHQVRTPRFDLFPGKKHHALCFEATRGCPFSCEFCVLTGLGTRHQTRPVEAVLGDIVAGQRMLADTVPAYKRRVVGLCDNNIGGNLPYLRALCEALTPLGIQWYGAATFNVIANPDLVRIMARSGCRSLFVGLESFNPATLADMRKYQNVIPKMRAALDSCRRHGILVISGLMVSPLFDSPEDIARIPENLDRCGLHVPTFIAFESPIPGTPHFHRLGRQTQPPAFMPDVLLRDLAGYTLTVRPQKASPEEFVAAYRAVTLGEAADRQDRPRPPAIPGAGPLAARADRRRGHGDDARRHERLPRQDLHCGHGCASAGIGAADRCRLPVGSGAPRAARAVARDRRDRRTAARVARITDRVRAAPSRGAPGPRPGRGSRPLRNRRRA